MFNFFLFLFLITFSGFYEVPQCYFVVSCHGVTDASEILQAERQPERNNEGVSVLAFISYMYFVLYKVIQRVKNSDILILQLLINFVIFIIEWHKLNTSVIQRYKL